MNSFNNFLPFHFKKFRRRVVSFDGLGIKLEQKVPKNEQRQLQKRSQSSSSSSPTSSSSSSSSSTSQSKSDDKKGPGAEKGGVSGGGSWASSYLIPIDYVTNYITSLFSGTGSKRDQDEAMTSSARAQESAKKILTFKRPKASISRDALRARTLALVNRLKLANSGSSQLMRTEELCRLLLAYPDCSSIAWKEGVVPLLFRWQRNSHDIALIGLISECFALLGHSCPVKGRGIRLLAIDGGGTRGLMALEILDALERMCPGYRIYNLFDYVIGVSTGALIAGMIGGLQLTIPQCKQIYREVAVKLFDQSRVAGSLGLLRSHSYYNTEQWIVLLRQAFGEKSLMDTTRNPNCPKLGIVSCVVEPRLEPFIFRNYYYHPDSQPTYLGSGAYKIWQALRASAAAPGYFEECKMDQFVHQDGGVLANNPTALGIHECKLIWPDAPLHCVVSVGNGRMAFLPHEPGETPKYSSAVDKLFQLIQSATETEKVHTMLNDLLPPSTYFRCNPYMTKPYGLDETDPQVLEQITMDAKLYARKNVIKLQSAAYRLMHPKSRSQIFKEYVQNSLLYYGSK